MKVFKKFASVCPLGISLTSIRPQSPPKPDILCMLRDGTKIEFELGEAVDRNYQRHLRLSIDQTLIGMREYYNSLPKVEKENFSQLYGDSQLGFTFQENATKRNRQDAYPDIFWYLSSFTPGVTGQLKEGDAGFPLICKIIRIDRGINGGPFFMKVMLHLSLQVSMK